MPRDETVAELVRLPRGAVLRLLGDQQLTRLAAHGHMGAFEAIFQRYHQELYRYCRAVLSDPHEAEDALQATMVSVLRALPGERRHIALRPWLYRIARNEAMSIVRRRAIPIDPQALQDGVIVSPDTDAATRERLRQLVADLGRLRERQRSALVMRELSGLGYGEIATVLNASEAAARQAVYEARVALRELEGGREMECEEARRALSEQDRRVLRGRRLRAHLRACEPCRDFRAGIERRRSDLEALCPPLSAVAASGLVASILGQGGVSGVGLATGSAAAAGVAGAGTGGAAGGATIAAAAGMKGVSLAAAVALGAGAAGATGVVNLPWTPERAAPESTPAAAEHGGRAGSDRPGRDHGAVSPVGDLTGNSTGTSGPGVAVDGGSGGGGNGDPKSPGRPSDDGAPSGSAAGSEGPARSSAEAHGSPAPAAAHAGPPPHAATPGAPPPHAGGPPVQAGPPAQAGPPPHASAGGSDRATAVGGRAVSDTVRTAPSPSPQKPPAAGEPRTQSQSQEHPPAPPAGGESDEDR
jgi:RNA polymerase sigma factor (sigma-70 family)